MVPPAPGLAMLICTLSPAERPLVISVAAPNTRPVVTSTVEAVPPSSLVTTVLPPSVRIAAVGTVSTSG